MATDVFHERLTFKILLATKIYLYYVGLSNGLEQVVA